jgi:hypothetical protein
MGSPTCGAGSVPLLLPPPTRPHAHRPLVCASLPFGPATAGKPVPVEDDVVPLRPAVLVPPGALEVPTDAVPDSPSAGRTVRPGDGRGGDPTEEADLDPGACLPPTVGACFTSDVLVRGVLCRSLGGNVLPLLTITDFAVPNDVLAKRPYVVLSARCAPALTSHPSPPRPPSRTQWRAVHSVFRSAVRCGVAVGGPGSPFP